MPQTVILQSSMPMPLAAQPYQWKPGTTGNRSGIPKAVRTVRNLCREMTREATERLGKLMRSDDEAIALAAIREIYIRGLGKPLESEQLYGKGMGDGLPAPPKDLSDDQLQRMLMIAREGLP